MMHEPAPHPDDELLSALAAGDQEATADPSLRQHVDGCARCGAVVDDLFGLRAALAQLPDVTPSRPLRLLPSVAAPRTTTFGGFARRLFAPAMVAGLVLMVVGGIGTYATHGFPGLGAASGPALYNAEDGRQPAVPAAGVPSGEAVTGGGGDSRDQTSEPRHPEPGHQPFEIPWPALLAGGLLMIVAAVVLRFVVQPRAG
jgi:hypothetical protein